MYPFSGCHFGLFLVYFVVFFSFLKTVCFLMKFCAYIIDNILLFDRLKSCMRVFSFDGGYFFGGGGEGGRGRGKVFCDFLLFLMNLSHIFAITLTITHKIVWLFSSPCKVILGSLFAHYIILLVLRNPKCSHVLHRFSHYSDVHLGKELLWFSLCLGHFWGSFWCMFF